MKTAEQVLFASREEFRAWLDENCLSVQSIWLVFGKKDGPRTISAQEALEEALCFGWIDGQMKSMDETTYVKYFAQRRKESKWSEKNKRLVEVLEQQGRITLYGRAKVEDAKKRGTWDAPKSGPVSDDAIEVFAGVLKDIEPAYSNFLAMSPSVRRTYAAHYLSAVSDQTKEKRLSGIVARLNNNLKPM